MFAAQSHALYEWLQDDDLIAPGRLQELYDEHRATAVPFADVLLAGGGLERRELLRRLAARLGYEYLGELPEHLPSEVIAAVDARLARTHRVMPVRIGPGTIDLVTADPFNGQMVDDLGFALEREVRYFVADPDEVDFRIGQHYGSGDGTVVAVPAIGDANAVPEPAHELSEHDLEAIAGQTPIIRLVDLVLSRAIRDRASDVHFEPFENEFRIRYRLDGVLCEMAPPPPALALPVISRLKVLANVNIAERRVPQDGRIRFTVDGRAVDLRLSTLPTQFGESVVLRVLDPGATKLNLDQLGMPPDVLAGVREVVRRPNGIFIVTGPTGSGKTTTLYSGLRAINSVDVKVLTAEDPVEYEIEGVMQMPVNPGIGLTFASALRSFLRQDPDVILVGEIRDLETAQIAIQAALTGHLVLTTLHTNDAAGAVTRLIDLGVEPFLIASTLQAVLAQRLVRRLCPACRAPVAPSPELARGHERERVDEAQRRIPAVDPLTPPLTCFQGRGCPACQHSGYLGRLGIFEWLPVNDSIRDLIADRGPTAQIRQQAIEQGMRSLREAGLEALRAGETSLEELTKYV